MAGRRARVRVRDGRPRNVLAHLDIGPRPVFAHLGAHDARVLGAEAVLPPLEDAHRNVAHCGRLAHADARRGGDAAAGAHNLRAVIKKAGHGCWCGKFVAVGGRGLRAAKGVREWLYKCVSECYNDRSICEDALYSLRAHLGGDVRGQLRDMSRLRSFASESSPFGSKPSSFSHHLRVKTCIFYSFNVSQAVADNCSSYGRNV